MFKKLLFPLTMLAVAAVAQEAPPDPMAYVIAVNGPTGASQYGTLNLKDGSFFLTRNYTPTFWGMTKSGDFIYAVDGDGILYKIDPATGEPDTIGPTGVAPSDPIGVSFMAAGGLATGEFYGVDSSSNLWSIDLKTGKATLVGNTGLAQITTPFFGTSLAGDDKYIYQTLEIAASPSNSPLIQEATLFRIDPATAKATKIGPAPSFIGGSALVGGKLYAFTIVLDDQGNFVGDGPTQEIDLTTANATALAVPAPCMGNGYGGFPLPPAAAATQMSRNSAVVRHESGTPGGGKSRRACARCTR